jgi:uncharacterized membrane protein YfhO
MVHRKKILVVMAICLFLWATFGHKLLFQSETLYSFDGAPWLDPGATRWGNASAAKIIQNIILDGELPLWNKFSGIGGPLFSDPHNSFFSPFSFILYLCPSTLGWDVMTLFRLFVFIYFTYRLFLYLAGSTLIAASMAILLGFSGHVYYFLNIVHMNSLVLTPLFLYGIISSFNGDKKRSLICITTSIPLMIFGGGLLDVVLIATYGALVTFAYLVDGFLAKKEKYIAPLGHLIVCTILGTLICGIYLLPYLELREVSVPPYSGRSNTVFNDQWYFLGTFFNQISITPDNSSNYYMSFRQYLHLIALPGFLMAVIFLWKLGKFRPVAIASLLFFLFYYTKLYDFKFMQFVNETPLLKHVRYEKYQGTFNLSFYLLSAVGLSHIYQNWDRIISRVFIAVCGLVSILPILYRLHHDLDPLLTVQTLQYTIIPLVLLVLIYGKHQMVEKGKFQHKKAIIYYACFFMIVFVQIKQDVDIKLPKSKDNFPEVPWIQEMVSLTQKQHTRVFPFTGLGPRLVSGYGVYDIRDYSDVHTERYLHFFKKYVEMDTGWHYFILSSAEPDKVNLSMAEFLGVRYLVVNDDQLKSLSKSSQHDYKIIKQFEQMHILELADPAPFFSVFDQFQVLPSEQIPKHLNEDNPSWRKKLLIEEEVNMNSGSDLELDYSISDINWKHNSISAKVSVNKESLLLVRSQYFPGWKAYLNEKEVPIKRGHYLFQTIQLSPGTNLVSLEYMPSSLVFGAIISLFGIIGCTLTYRKYKLQSDDQQ